MALKQVKEWVTKSENLLLVATLLGVIFGVALGIGMREANLSQLDTIYFKFPGDMFLNMLKMIILPLIVFSLITGVSNLDKNASGKLGARAVVYYMSTTFIAVIIGIVMVVSIRPGAGGKADLTVTENSIQAEPVDSLLDLIRNLLPENLIQACFQRYTTQRVAISFEFVNVTDGNETTLEQVATDYKITGTFSNGVNVLGLIAFSLVFGVIIGGMGEDGEILIKFFNAANEAIMRIVNIVIWFTPVGVMFLIAGEIMKMPDIARTMQSLGLYMATVISGLLIHGLIVLPLLYLLIVRKNPYAYLTGVAQALLTAVSTASSSATLPITINCLENNNGIDRRITRFVLPIGATINMDGTALYEAVAAIFIAQLNNIDLNFGQIVTTCLTATLASIGAAGIPSAGLVTLIIVLQSVSLPTEDIAVILAVDWFLDRIRTSINVLGDSVGAGIISHLSRDDITATAEEDDDSVIKTDTANGDINYGYVEDNTKM